MIDPEEPDADFKMMTTPKEWPAWPVLPLKKPGWKVAVLIEAFPVRAAKGVYFIPNKTMFDKIVAADLKDAKLMLMESDYREILANGWVVD